MSGLDGSVEWLRSTLGDWVEKAFDLVKNIPKLLTDDLGGILGEILKGSLPGLVKKLIAMAAPGVRWIGRVYDLVQASTACWKRS